MTQEKKCECGEYGDYHHNKCPYFMENPENRVDTHQDWKKEFRKEMGKDLDEKSVNALVNFISNLLSQRDREWGERLEISEVRFGKTWKP